MWLTVSYSTNFLLFGPKEEFRIKLFHRSPVVDHLPLMRLFTTLLFLAGSAAATDVKVPTPKSSVVIMNKCKYSINVWSIGDKNPSPSIVPPLDGVWTEQCYRKVNGGGISIKLSQEPFLNDATSLIQLEYTMSHDALWYDLSYIGANPKSRPFPGNNVSLVPSERDCPEISCLADEAICLEVYNKPSDDHATKRCNVGTTLYLNLCGKQDPAVSNDANRILLPKGRPF